MNKRFTILFLFVLCTQALCFTKTWAAENSKLLIGTSGTEKPFTYYDGSGTLTGFEIELVKEMCKTMNTECEFVIIPFDGEVPALIENHIDAIASALRVTDKWKKIIDFTDPYFFATPQFIQCNQRILKGFSPDDLAGVVFGSTGGTENTRHLKETYAKTSTIREYSAMNEMLEDLANGRLDIGLTSQPKAANFVHSELGKGCRMIGDASVGEWYTLTYSLAIAVRKNDDKIHNKLNDANHIVISNGSFDRIKTKYFSFPKN